MELSYRRCQCVLYHGCWDSVHVNQSRPDRCTYCSHWFGTTYSVVDCLSDAFIIVTTVRPFHVLLCSCLSLQNHLILCPINVEISQFLQTDHTISATVDTMSVHQITLSITACSDIFNQPQGIRLTPKDKHWTQPLTFWLTAVVVFRYPSTVLHYVLCYNKDCGMF